MTQEEKLEEARLLYKDANADQRYVLEQLFPELKDGDERVKNALINIFKHKNQSFIDELTNYSGNIKIEEVLSWLEKQGNKSQGKLAQEAVNEEKVDNANKVEPKFKEQRKAIKYGRNTILSELEKIVKDKEEAGNNYVFAFSEVKELIERIRHENNSVDPI